MIQRQQHPLRQRSAIARRWVWIVILALCGVLTTWAVMRLELSAPKWLASNAETLTCGWLGFSLMTILWAIALSSGGLNVAFALGQFRRLRFPSISWAVFLSAVAAPFLAATAAEIPVSVSLALPLAALLTGSGLKTVVQFLLLASPDPSRDRPAIPAHDPELPTEQHWILEERPQERLEDDLFERGHIVRRIVRVLTRQSSDGSIGAVGLVGEYGSGKSTISRFVEDELKSAEGQFVFVRVPGWGVENQTLVGYVLRCIVDALERRGVDCFAVRGLSREYLVAVGVINSKAGKVADAVCSTLTTPDVVLRRLVPMLVAMDLRLVLCIEDVERSASRDALQAMAALLDRFRAVSRVTFIVEANSNSSANMDLSRTCDHIEIVPALPATEAWQRLASFRQACVDYASKHRDCLPAEEYLEARSQPPASPEEFFWSDITDLTHAFADQAMSKVKLTISHVIGTPRVFKHSLRRTWQSWRALHGEVDLRELILLNILRDANPSAFDFVLKNMNELRGVVSIGRGDEKEQERRKALHERWIASMIDESSESVDGALAILTVIDMNFVDDFAGVMRRQNALQSVHHPRSNCDYFHRILTGESEAQGLSDQEVLRDLRAWRDGTQSELVQRMLSDMRYAEKVMQFRSYLDEATNGRRFCDEYLACALERHGPRADRDLPGFDLFRALATQGLNGGAAHHEWLTAKIDAAFEVSLRMVHTLHMLAERQSDGGRAVRDHVASSFIRRVSGAPDYLERVLDPGFPYTLRHILRFRGEYPSFNTAEDWQPIVPSLLSAARAAPGAIVPQWVNLLTRKREGIDVEEGVPLFFLERDYAEKLLHQLSERQELIDLFSAYVRMPQAQRDCVEAIRSVDPELHAFVRDEPPPDGDGTAGTFEDTELDGASVSAT